jgi:glutathione S-transferase
MAENLKVDLELKDISEDEALQDELIAKGGQSQVPFLVDTERDTSMYESSDIIEYIREHYANTGSATAESKPKIHVGGSTCESCEG